jgi:hypothetical protein
MENIKMKVEGSILKIEIDLSSAGKPSKSGKSIVIASTAGNVSVGAMPEVKIGINCYKPKD